MSDSQTDRETDRQRDVAKLIGNFLNFHGEDGKREFNVRKK